MPDTMVTAQPRRKVEIQSALVPSIAGLRVSYSPK